MEQLKNVVVCLFVFTALPQKILYSSVVQVLLFMKLFTG